MRVLVVDHHDSYTHNLVHLIAAVTGDLPDVAQHDEGVDFTGITHVVLSPGPGHPDNPADFALGRAVFKLGLPVLGVCLGMQALVSSYGGQVGRIEPAHGEVAQIDHNGAGLFARVPQGFAAVRYHSLAALIVPDVIEVTARDRDSGVVMGVAHRDLPLAGVQFHPESILSEQGERIVANFMEWT